MVITWPPILTDCVRYGKPSHGVKKHSHKKLSYEGRPTS